MAKEVEEKEIEITPQMIEAGVAILDELQGEVGSAYLVREIYLAMAGRSSSCGEREMSLSKERL
ncbi:MAG: hypothetical protein KDJ55_04030 [Rhodobiaceae bacterium]|nr:hypothetical protein [Rhodobiaceae bacterium]MCC0012929.1 hypothetical protein [Rhodobiaceae bacterium]MCC0018950.1 hypothetical protein [Rhodobiaceae bacterium]MCC0060044.1 hypothetical protein [Rhodobiaceae bacterium]